MASPGLAPGEQIQLIGTFPLAVLWVRGELRMLRLTWEGKATLITGHPY